MENLRDIQFDSGILQESSLSRRTTRINKRAKAKIRNKNALKIRILTTSIVLSLLFFLQIQSSYTDMVNISSNNLIMKSNNDKLLVEVNNLEQYISPLMSEERIAKIAKSRLNMVIPEKDNIIEVANNDDANYVDLENNSADEINEENKSVLSAITNMFR